MKTAMLGLLAETSVHPGAGRSMGVVDLPVAREAATDYPVLVGSSVKGALRDKAETNNIPDYAKHFGERNQAGALLISDGRLLLLPVRSLTSSYRWVTCPHLIERYQRDLKRTGLASEFEVPANMDSRKVLAVGNGLLFLEERQFTISGWPKIDDLVKAIKPLILHPKTQGRLRDRIAVLDDKAFAWFVRYGLAIQARNVLDDKTKKSKNLWYEETLPPDTIMYVLVSGRNPLALDSLEALFPKNDPYLQAGGNETVGQGWFAVTVRSNGGGDMS